MSYVDLETTLRDWTYDPDQISVRKIIGVDGNVKVQMRIELGVLQMEATGRPDGAASLLDHHRKRLARFEQRNGTTLGFSLSPQQCQDLRSEASLYYRRFVSFFVLEEYEEVIRDTSHSLGIFDLCREYAAEAEDRIALESFRAYVLMMDARARANEAIEEGEPASALAHVNRGIMHLKSFFEDSTEGDATESIEHSGELRILRDLAKDISASIPEDSPIVTRKALRVAIEEERFEEAARLRDALKEFGFIEE